MLIGNRPKPNSQPISAPPHRVSLPPYARSKPKLAPVAGRGAAGGVEGLGAVKREGVEAGVVLRGRVVAPKAGLPQGIAGVIHPHVTVVVEMVLATHAGISGPTSGNRKLPVHAEVGLEIHAHQHADAEMPGPVIHRLGRNFDPQIARQWLRAGRLLRAGHPRETEAQQRSPVQNQIAPSHSAGGADVRHGRGDVTQGRKF